MERQVLYEDIAPSNAHGVKTHTAEGAATSGYEGLMPFVGDAIENRRKDREQPGANPATRVHLKGPPQEDGEHSVLAYMRQLPEHEVIDRRKWRLERWERGQSENYPGPEEDSTPSEHGSYWIPGSWM